MSSSTAGFRVAYGFFVDALPPPPPPEIRPTYPIAASDVYAQSPREASLCSQAAGWDWVYLTGLFVLDAGSITANVLLKEHSSPWVRMMGPASIGLAWGASVSGAYLSAPKCRPEYVPTLPPEGDIRTSWHLAAALALTGAALAPIVTGMTTGPLSDSWSTEERTSRILVSIGFGLGGGLLPYLLPPKPWRAMKELTRLRIESNPGGAMLTYRTTF